MTALMEDLDEDQDVTRLKELEAVIQRNKTQFLEFGQALREISEQKLYKLKNGGEYRTFEAYCKSIWELSRPRAYQLIDAAKTVENLSSLVDKDELNERVVRPLTELTNPDVQIEAFREAQRHASIEGRTVTARHVQVAVEKFKEDDAEKFSPIIKPMDSWNFSPIYYGKVAIDEEDASGDEKHGYIPGDVYCNALWYYTKPNDVVVEPMAGSGQIWRVWDQRERKVWMRPEPWDLDIRTFDLNPRGPYKDRIRKWDLTQGWPLDFPADYIFMDIPYLGMCREQYSDSSDDLANQEEAAWTKSIQQIAWSCACGQEEGGLVTVVTPNWRDTDEGSIVMTTLIVVDAFRAAGYGLYDKAYQSRRVQQAQGPRPAELNNLAKANKVMLTDISEVLTFRRKS